MRTLFKTSSDTAIDWFSHPAKLGWYLVLLAAMLALPLYFLWQNDSYLLGEVTSVLIFAIAGLGLMLLTGQTGLASLGHAAEISPLMNANAIAGQPSLMFILHVGSLRLA